MITITNVQQLRIKVPSLNVHQHIAKMPSLAQQFKEFNKTQKSQVSHEVVSSMTLEELESEKIVFGEAKKGQTFSKAFEDQAWTEFILSRFENSEKPEHMMYIHYIRLRLQAEQKKSKVPQNTKEDTKSTKGMPPVPHDVWEELQPVDGTEAVMNVAFVQEEMHDLRQSNQSLFHRVGQIEFMMQEVLEHLRKMPVKTET